MTTPLPYRRGSVTHADAYLDLPTNSLLFYAAACPLRRQIADGLGRPPDGSRQSAPATWFGVAWADPAAGTATE